MRLFALALTAGLALAPAPSQSFDGTYVASSPQGSLTLVLEQSGATTVTGSVTGPGIDGTIQAELQGPAAVGVLTIAGAQSFFRAEFDGEILLVTVVEPNILGQPDYDTAEQFRFRRQAAEEGSGDAGSGSTDAPVTGSDTSGSVAPGEVGDPSWGFAFTPPAGWIHQVQGQQVVLGSRTDKGLILVLGHEFGSVEALRAAAREGIVEGGLQLQVSGPVEDFGDNGVAVELQGTAEGQPARGFAVGLVSPFDWGVTLITLVEAASYDDAYAERVRAMARSARFWDPPTPPVAEEWRQRLAGHCLAYLSSYSSGSSGGFSDRSKMYLYPDGSYEGSSSSSMAFDVSGGFGSSFGSSGPQAGTWRVIAPDGNPVLEIGYTDGRVGRHALSRNAEGHTLLDGDRWFVVSYAECNDL